MAADALTACIQHCQGETMIFVGLQEIPCRHLYAYVGGEGRVRYGLGGEAFISAGFLDGGHHEGLQHSGGVGSRRKSHLRIQVAGCIEPRLEEIKILGVVGSRGLIETVALESLERCSGSLAQGDLGPGGHIAGHSSGKPRGASLEVGRLPCLHDRRIGGSDLQAVRLDGFDVQGLMETASAHLQVGIPISGRIVGLGDYVEAEEAVRTLAGGLAVELACGSIYFQGGGMACGQILAPVRNDGGNVEGISRTPHSPFAVDEGLDALLDHLSSDIETAGRALVACVDLEVGSAAAGLCHDGEGLAVGIQA